MYFICDFLKIKKKNPLAPCSIFLPVKSNGKNLNTTVLFNICA